MKKFDYTGKFSGNIEFIREVGKSPNGNYIYECKCHKCGKNFTSTTVGIFNYFAKSPRGSDKSLKQCKECQKKQTEKTRRYLVSYDKSMKAKIEPVDKNVKCNYCRKAFSTGRFCMADYAYKYKGLIFCSYSCYNKYLKSIENSILRKFN